MSDTVRIWTGGPSAGPLPRRAAIGSGEGLTSPSGEVPQ